MFTGIVEHIGEIKSIDEGHGNTLYTITNASPILGDCHLGDSIAVNGVCLTVTAFNSEEFTVGVSSETFRRTDLQQLQVGSPVNLERAMSSTSTTRFGGHYVQGHVDGTATISSCVKDDDESLLFTFKMDDPRFIRYVVEKGFICIDGTSLTVTEVDNSNATFGIMMVVHTQQHVIMPQKKIGDSVNIEVDVSAKAIEKQVAIQLEGQLIDESSVISKLIKKYVEEKVEEVLKK
ncbi:riboflavin synthase [Saccharomycopsis crataegensis]|uniref:Riboflavin synthase n=1 Tax=Saccharomycopsis crataegensis TaxID=43959 RepID=A0AAV5QLJ0_9ASCO|nr:riboflavin synthase [Saccharomycopsis crataegensis]